MSKNYIKIDAKADIQNIAPIRVGVISCISNLDIHVDEIMDIKTALSEAVTNAIEHAYTNDEESNNIIVRLDIEDDEKIIIQVEDFGNGIEDITLAMTPAYTSKPESEHAGMGFTIMESFMDEVIVDSKLNEGTKVMMSKKIRKRKSQTDR